MSCCGCCPCAGAGAVGTAPGCVCCGAYKALEGGTTPEATTGTGTAVAGGDDLVVDVGVGAGIDGSAGWICD